MMNLIDLAKQERKRQLVAQERLERVTSSGGTAAYEPGERWRNNKQYLTGDSVKDGNGNVYFALQDNINKSPANNPEHWKRESAGEEVFTPWSNDPVGTQYFDGSGGNPQSLRRHNSANWKCIQAHTKTAGNAPKVGSELWEKVI